MDDKNSTRARNRTVMLTPDVAGQVRSQLTPLPPAHDADLDPQIERGFEPPEVTETFVGRNSSAEPADTEQDNSWTRPVLGTPEPAQESENAGWSNGNAYHEPEEEEAVIPKPAKREEGQVGYRNTSRSESEEVVWQSLTPLCGFLVSFDKNPLGEYVELRSGRLIVTSERPATGNYLFIDDSSVSPMHAIMRVSTDSPPQILDQLSDNGTKIIRAETGKEEMLSGEKSILNHGDVVGFGDRNYQVCLIVGSSK